MDQRLTDPQFGVQLRPPVGPGGRRLRDLYPEAVADVDVVVDAVEREVPLAFAYLEHRAAADRAVDAGVEHRSRRRGVGHDQRVHGHSGKRLAHPLCVLGVADDDDAGPVGACLHTDRRRRRRERRLEPLPDRVGGPGHRRVDRRRAVLPGVTRPGQQCGERRRVDAPDLDPWGRVGVGIGHRAGVDGRHNERDDSTPGMAVSAPDDSARARGNG